MAASTQNTYAKEVFDKIWAQFDYLYSRWQDEFEYEDFADYIAVMKSKLEEHEGVKFVRALKRPFGCVYTVHDVKYQIKVTAREVSYYRLK